MNSAESDTVQKRRESHWFFLLFFSFFFFLTSIRKFCNSLSTILVRKASYLERLPSLFFLFSFLPSFLLSFFACLFVCLFSSFLFVFFPFFFFFGAKRFLGLVFFDRTISCRSHLLREVSIRSKCRERAENKRKRRQSGAKGSSAQRRDRWKPTSLTAVTAVFPKGGPSTPNAVHNSSRRTTIVGRNAFAPKCSFSIFTCQSEGGASRQLY